MVSLFFADKENQDRFYFHGAGVVPPVRGTSRQPKPDQLEGGLVEEVLTIECKNGDIRGLVTGLEQRLALAKAGIQPLYLWIESDLSVLPVGAQVLDGQVELLGGGTADRLHGYQGLRLRLVRANWLAETLTTIRLQNANGTNNTTGLSLFNHTDGGTGHVNYCDVVGSDVRGSQPLPVRFTLDVGGPTVRRLGKIAVSGGADLWDAGGSFDHVLEGESASAGAGCSGMTSISNLSASGGAYQNFQWTAVVETSVCRWTIDTVRLNWLKGRGLRPVARFHTQPPANTRWRWKILQADGVEILDQSAPALLDTSSRLQVLPAFFPPVQSNLAPFSSFILEGWLECPAAGTKQIDLDFIHLFPLENFAFFQPVSGLDENHSLVMDWSSGELHTADNATGDKSITHLVSGTPMILHPGRNHRIYMLYESNSGFLTSDSARLRLAAGARWINP
jgi:hypothetical protein